MNQRLLERIRSLETDSDQLESDDRAVEINSILKHLKLLLNSRRGTALIADDYGMPDVFFTQGTSFSENTRRIALALADVIQKFEPRLKNVRVAPQPRKKDLLEQQFAIHASLARDASITVEINAVVASDGSIKTSE
jgi:type VI secretion system protein